MTALDDLEKLSALMERGMLTADEFEKLKARVLAETEPGENAPKVDTPVRRSRTDRWLGGVCGGIAHHWQREAWQVRLLFTALCLFWGAGVFFYVLLWIFVPQE